MKDDISSVLWDIKKENYSNTPDEVIIQRVLAYGTIGLIMQTLKKYSIQSVRAVFDSLKPTAIPRKKYLYLKNYLLK